MSDKRVFHGIFRAFLHIFLVQKIAVSKKANNGPSLTSDRALLLEQFCFYIIVPGEIASFGHEKGPDPVVRFSNSIFAEKEQFCYWSQNNYNGPGSKGLNFQVTIFPRQILCNISILFMKNV